MKLVDANVLLHAVNQDTADHAVAEDWLNRSLTGGAPVGFAWLALVAFVRLSTRPGLFARPLAVEEATGVVRSWLAQRTAYVLHPTARHAEVLGNLLAAVGTAGNLTNDAHLAALAIEHRAQVVTFDADFDRFPDVRWARPS